MGMTNDDLLTEYHPGDSNPNQAAWLEFQRSSQIKNDIFAFAFAWNAAMRTSEAAMARVLDHPDFLYKVAKGEYVKWIMARSYSVSTSEEYEGEREKWFQNTILP